MYVCTNVCTCVCMYVCMCITFLFLLQCIDTLYVYIYDHNDISCQIYFFANTSYFIIFSLSSFFIIYNVFNKLDGLNHLKGQLRSQSFQRENLVRTHFGLFVHCAEGLEWLKAYRRGGEVVIIIHAVEYRKETGVGNEGGKERG